MNATELLNAYVAPELIPTGARAEPGAWSRVYLAQDVESRFPQAFGLSAAPGLAEVAQALTAWNIRYANAPVPAYFEHARAQRRAQELAEIIENAQAALAAAGLPLTPTRRVF